MTDIATAADRRVLMEEHKKYSKMVHTMLTGSMGLLKVFVHAELINGHTSPATTNRILVVVVAFFLFIYASLRVSATRRWGDPSLAVLLDCCSHLCGSDAASSLILVISLPCGSVVMVICIAWFAYTIYKAFVAWNNNDPGEP